jgi:hypothetical protein
MLFTGRHETLDLIEFTGTPNKVPRAWPARGNPLGIELWREVGYTNFHLTSRRGS